MSLPLNLMVLLFFLFIALILFIIFALNSKFKWRMIANDRENLAKKLNTKISSSSNIKKDFTDSLNEIKDILTERQFEIFILTIEGLSSKEIAENVNLSPNTIDSQIKEICKILGVKKRSQLGSVFYAKLKERIGLESFLDV